MNINDLGGARMTVEKYLRRQRERRAQERTEHTHQMYGCITDVLTHDHGVAQVPGHTHSGHICATIVIGVPPKRSEIGLPVDHEDYIPDMRSNWVDYGPAVY